jgi:hypothetical protein
MPRRYRLEISEEQARVISLACELLSRLHMGQLNAAADVHVQRDCFHALADELRKLKPMLTGMPQNAHWGITGPELPDEARVAFDLHQVIRHRLAWDHDPNGDTDSRFDEPVPFSTTESLATIHRRGIRGGFPGTSNRKRFRDMPEEPDRKRYM